MRKTLIAILVTGVMSASVTAQADTPQDRCQESTRKHFEWLTGGSEEIVTPVSLSTSAHDSHYNRRLDKCFMVYVFRYFRWKDGHPIHVSTQINLMDMTPREKGIYKNEGGLQTVYRQGGDMRGGHGPLHVRSRVACAGTPIPR